MDYIVGKNYDEFISLREVSRFDFDGTNAQITLLWKNLKPEQARQVCQGGVFFQIFLREGIIFLLIKFGTLEWIDIPFVSHNKAQKLVLPPSENHGYATSIILADAMCGKVLANRVEALSHGLSKALYWAVKMQSENPPKDIERKINKVHASFSSKEMARLSLGK